MHLCRVGQVTGGPELLYSRQPDLDYIGMFSGYHFCEGGRGGSVYGYGSGTDWKLVNGVHSI